MNIKQLTQQDRGKSFWAFCILALFLSTWGLGNVFYWEIYKGYPACDICVWHKNLYIALFCLTVLFIKSSKYYVKKLILLIIGSECAVSLFQISSMFCDKDICRIISTGDQINFVFAMLAFVMLLSLELYNYCIDKKNNCS